MQLSAALEQHIAVFGESGSGKTVLLSSFYGATQEPQYRKKALFDVVADDFGQGTRLHRNYLGMKNSARLPELNRFSATSYAFSLKLKPGSDAKAAKGRPIDALRLVWHDYPGEWFEQDVSGPEEAERRVDTFRSLLRSDVALLLVDGQRLVDNAGEEERYLKSLLANVRNGLLKLRDDLLPDGKPLVEFPRIWIMALSKSDLLPDLDVFAFRDLLVDKAGEDLNELRTVIAGLVEAGDALSVGEDFLLLSSAKFEVGAIRVTERVGLEMILPLAAMLPFERHIRWARAKLLPGKVAETLLRGVAPLANVLTKRLGKLPGPLGRLSKFVGPGLEEVARLAGDKLREVNAEALAEHDYLRATLTGFQLDLERGEAEHIFLKSPR
ncbi:TRAFAC clade GTPase domain-containing protein [Geodermatophilus poikilotrophus]|uniref:Double-GTPase 2 domain-containing protein n=1 Tax=Geodermatophilus poikilotrophus TaxID=1333667 RepID=A0A1I0A112_9ACTN|nr:ATP/GTP-binding protein [Geodermatophilus poikilotrophus]SES86833.1 hypothetical protein SAMN04488546_0836 [Geodermatophilus poikilotrophus]